MRPSGRQVSELRPISIEPGFTRHAEGSCLIKVGNTHVLCTASVEDKPPPFLRNTGLGWVTAEYGMLPGPPTPARAGKPRRASSPAARRRSSG